VQPISVSDTPRVQSPLHIVTATFHLKDPSLTDELLGFLNQVLDVTRDFKGCRLVEVSVSEDKKAVILYQKWVSRAAYDLYMQFRREEGALGPVMAKCCAVPPITVVHAELSSI
jgi:quinol monooxygenase YgiN